ncbi:chemotaxis protein CheB [Brenneria goodwinii]|uniref:chemotaxis protein CheB n=1 Tax=Brenneria goodwinii TaxID=1109412 RepID=UPI0036E2F673
MMRPPLDSDSYPSHLPVSILLAGPADLRARTVNWIAADMRTLVVGEVADGASALSWLLKRRADILLFIVDSAGDNVLSAACALMRNTPLPIIIARLQPFHDPDWERRVRKTGVLAALPLPPLNAATDHPEVRHLLDLLPLMAEVRVVRQRIWSRPPGETERAGRAVPRLIGIGASTGGPPVLQTILSNLPEDFDLPILIVQHITPGFLNGLAEWLQSSTSLRVSIGEHGDRPEPGCVYLAPDGWQMVLDRNESIALKKNAAGQCIPIPSVASLFRSLVPLGPAAIGVLLTGMGQDGALEMSLMKERGAITIAQDRESSVVHGMPGAAIGLGGASHVLAADRIADVLTQLGRPDKTSIGT